MLLTVTPNGATSVASVRAKPVTAARMLFESISPSTGCLTVIDVTYDTPRAVVARIPAMIREIVEAQKPVRFDRSHFSGYGESALRFETVYFVLDPDYNRHMDIQQAIFLAVLERFEREGIEFAFPTRTIVHKHEGERPAEEAGA